MEQGTVSHKIGMAIGEMAIQRRQASSVLELCGEDAGASWRQVSDS